MWNIVGETEGSWTFCYSVTLLSVFTDPESVQKIHPASNDCVFQVDLSLAVKQ